MVEKPIQIPITGMAWITPLGENLGEVWHALLNGETAIREYLCPFPLRNYDAAFVDSVDLSWSAEDRLLCLAHDTAIAALKDARIEPSDPDLAMIIGTSFGSQLDGSSETNPNLSYWTKVLGEKLGMVRSPLTISTACSSGADAILLGAKLIRSGYVRKCLCGGVDVLTSSKRIAHSAMGTMSNTLLRAFDKRHNGTILGEGAGFVVLEEEPLPTNELHGLLRGAGSANGAVNLTTPHANGSGAIRAINSALKDALMNAEEVSIISAHGSGTPINDTAECEAFKSVFSGVADPIIFATKGAFGHSLGATGAIEAITTLLALKHQIVPPITGLEEPNPSFPFLLPLARHGAVRLKGSIGISVTLGFGGFDTCLLFEALK